MQVAVGEDGAGEGAGAEESQELGAGGQIRHGGEMRTIRSLLIAMFLGLGTAASAQQLPSQLSDAEFWKIVSEYSEPTGTFPSENFASNETGFQHVIPELLRTTKPGGVYIGVGPEQNFTYIAALHPKMAFIVDIRRQAVMQHLVYKAVFELSSNRADFLALFFSRPRPKGLDDSSTAQGMMAAFDSVATDSTLAAANFDRIAQWLTKHHGFDLSADDTADIHHVYRIITRDGPHLSYSSRDGISGTFFLPPPAGIVVTCRGVPTQGSGMTQACDTTHQLPVDRIQGTLSPGFVMSFGTGGGGGGAIGFRGRVDLGSLMAADDGTGEQRSFLANEESYRTVRDLELRNMFVPVVGDVSGPKALRSVARYLADHHATVTAYYTSNVEQYLFQHGVWQAFYDNVAQLPLDSASTFIRSVSASVLEPMKELLAAVAAGQLTTYAQVRAMSHP
jgi:hypothetical protein